MGLKPWDLERMSTADVMHRMEWIKAWINRGREEGLE